MESCEQCGAPMPVEASFCESCGHVAGFAGFGPSQGPKQPVHLEPDPAWQEPPDQGLPVDPAAPPADTPYQAPGDAFAQAPIAGPDIYRAPGEAFPQPPAARQQHLGQLGSPYAYPSPETLVTARTAARDRLRRTVISYSSAIGAAGLLIVISTFLAWISFFNFFSVSGWSTMVHPLGANTSNFLFVSEEGVLFFTGFWSLLLGSAVIGGAVMLYLSKDVGAKISLAAGALGGVLMLTNIITLATNGGKAGVGVWLFDFLGLATVILSETAIRKIRW